MCKNDLTEFLKCHSYITTEKQPPPPRATSTTASRAHPQPQQQQLPAPPLPPSTTVGMTPAAAARPSNASPAAAVAAAPASAALAPEKSASARMPTAAAWAAQSGPWLPTLAPALVSVSSPFPTHPVTGQRGGATKLDASQGRRARKRPAGSDRAPPGPPPAAALRQPVHLGGDTSPRRLLDFQWRLGGPKAGVARRVCVGVVILATRPALSSRSPQTYEWVFFSRGRRASQRRRRRRRRRRSPR